MTRVRIISTFDDTDKYIQQKKWLDKEIWNLSFSYGLDNDRIEMYYE